MLICFRLIVDYIVTVTELEEEADKNSRNLVVFNKYEIFSFD